MGDRQAHGMVGQIRNTPNDFKDKNILGNSQLISEEVGPQNLHLHLRCTRCPSHLTIKARVVASMKDILFP